MNSGNCADLLVSAREIAIGGTKMPLGMDRPMKVRELHLGEAR